MNEGTRDGSAPAVRPFVESYLGYWRGSGTAGRIALALAAVLGLALLAAFLFGAWHVVVGGLVKGNPRAAAFGVGLAAVSGLALGGLAFGSRWVAARR